MNYLYFSYQNYEYRLNSDVGLNEGLDFFPILKKKDSRASQTFKFDENLLKLNKIASDIVPIDILGKIRYSFFENYYIRSFDNILEEEFFKLNSNLLIIGNSLSGKTRAVYELINHLNKIDKGRRPILIPHISKGYKVENSYVHKCNPEDRPIVIIDDIDQYYKFEEANNLISNLIEGNFQIIATCRTGPELKLYKEKSLTKIKEAFKIISIERIEENEKNKIFEHFNKSEEEIENSFYDSNIGSIVIPLEKMRERYDLLRINSNELNDLSLCILMSLKALYYSSNFKYKSIYEKSKIKDYTLRKMIGKFAVANADSESLMNKEMMNFQRKLHEPKIISFHQHFDEAIKILKSDDINLNFITEEGDYIEIEEVYLEKIVREYKGYEILRDINKNYTLKEKTELGYYVRPDVFNTRIENSNSYGDVLKIIRTMKEQGINKNSETYSKLIRKSENIFDAQKWFNEAISRKLYGTSIFGELINKLQDFKEVKRYYDKYHESKIKIFDFSDESICWLIHMLLSNKKIKISFPEMMEFIDLHPIKLSRGVLNSILNRCCTYEQGIEWVKVLKSQEIELDEVFYRTLLEKVDSYDQGLKLMEDLKSQKIELGEHFYRELLKKVDSYDQGLKLIEDLKSQKIDLDKVFYRTLLEKVDSYDQGLKLMEYLKSQKIKLGEHFYRELLNKVDSYDQGLKLMEDLKSQKIELGEHFYRELLKKVDSYDQGLKLIEDLKSQKIELDETSNNIINKIKDFGKLFNIIENLFNKGIFKNRDLELINLLTTKASKSDHFEKIKNFCNNNNLDLPHYFFNQFIFNSATLIEAKSIIDTNHIEQYFPILKVTSHPQEADLNYFTRILEWVFTREGKEVNLGVRKFILNDTIMLFKESILTNNEYQSIFSKHMGKIKNENIYEDIMEIVEQIENCTQQNLQRP